MIRVVLIGLYLLFHTSCSNKASTEPKTFKIKLGNSVSQTQVQGGITFGAFQEGQSTFFNDLSLTDFSGDVPQGAVRIFMVAYSGPSPWQGTKYCGFVEMEVGAEEESVGITLSTARCALAPEYQIVMNEKIDGTNIFGAAIFGQGQFAP